jgi:hypothetical protein
VSRASQYRPAVLDAPIVDPKPDDSSVPQRVGVITELLGHHDVDLVGGSENPRGRQAPSVFVIAHQDRLVVTGPQGDHAIKPAGRRVAVAHEIALA